MKDVFVEHPNTGPSWPTYDNRFAKPNPCGFGSARLATLAFAPPPPQGLARSSQKAIYRKVFTPACDELERAIEKHREARPTMSDDEYFRGLEVLLREIARLRVAPASDPAR